MEQVDQPADASHQSPLIGPSSTIGATLPPGFLPHVIQKSTTGVRIGTVASISTALKLDVLIVDLREGS